MIWNEIARKAETFKIEVDLLWTLTLVIHRLIKLPSFLHAEFRIVFREEPETLQIKTAAAMNQLVFAKLQAHQK